MVNPVRLRSVSQWASQVPEPTGGTAVLSSRPNPRPGNRPCPPAKVWLITPAAPVREHPVPCPPGSLLQEQTREPEQPVRALLSAY